MPSKTILLSLILLSSPSAILSIFPLTAHPETIHVPSDYRTIQEAIDAADSGGRIFVASGVYYENLTIGKSVRLVGEDPNTTIIDGGRAAPNTIGVFVAADEVEISGFAVRNTSFGIFLYGCSNILLIRNVIEQNGAGIAGLNTDNSLIIGNTISNITFGDSLTPFIDSLSRNGTLGALSRLPSFGAVAIAGSRNTVSQNNIMFNNGDGLYLYGYHNVVDQNSIASNNGVGVLLIGSNNTLIRNNISHNGWNGVSILLGDANTVSRNTVASNGGDGISLILGYHNILSWNVVRSNFWKGISLHSLSKGNNITKNKLISNGYGVSLHDSYDNIISGNLIAFNELSGINFTSSDNNLFYNNYIHNRINVEEGSSGYNRWNTTITPGFNIVGGPLLGGNYWSDYKGVDEDGDGIGDEPHAIQGVNTDMLPLVFKSPMTVGGLPPNTPVQILFYTDPGKLAHYLPTSGTVTDAEGEALFGYPEWLDAYRMFEGYYRVVNPRNWQEAYTPYIPLIIG